MGGAWSRRLGGFLMAASLLLAFAVGSQAATAAPLGSPCSSALGDHSRCLRVTVPLDRSGAVPGTISLRVRILPAQAPSETVLALAGGPGQAAAPLLEQFAQALGAKTLRSRQLVTFDQRGTGGSGRLTCPSFAGPDTTLDPGGAEQSAVAACASRLGPARAHYSTADSVADIEAVRAALGVDRLVLYGTSYGTKVALDYAAAYPQHVTRLLLDSVVPPEGIDPFQRVTLGSIPRVLHTLCAGGGCPFTHDADADVAALAQRLGRGPLHGRWIDAHGHARRVAMTSEDLFSLLLDGDLNPFERAALPAAVRAALNGDAMPIMRLVVPSAESLNAAGGDSDALYVATTCDDGAVPWAPGTPIGDRPAAIAAALAAIPAAQLAPFAPERVRALGTADLCRAWPEAPITQPHGPLPAVPTLILSGDDDLRTPRAAALAVAARIPGARVLRVPQVGHSVLGSDLGDCSSSAVSAFFAGRQPRDCRSRTQRFVAPSPLPPPSLRAVHSPPGLPLRIGRTTAAAIETLSAASGQLVTELLPSLLASGTGSPAAQFGGLRGGTLGIGARALSLHRYSYIPGVTVSARLDLFRGQTAFRLHVGGAAAAHGWISIGRHIISGRLDGRRVQVSARALASVATAVAAARISTQAPDETPRARLSALLRALPALD